VYVLQKGERSVGLDFISLSSLLIYYIRYINVDYVFGSAITLFQQLTIIVGYDTACQWYSNFLKRIEMDYPEESRPHGVEIRVVLISTASTVMTSKLRFNYVEHSKWHEF
jgi:hypothetical protein